MNLSPGRKRRHGGHTYLMTGRLPVHRKYMEAFLTAARIGLIQDYGPTEQDLSTAQMIIIDRMIAKTGCIRCMEEAVAETGVMQGRRLAPVLRESFLAYSNSLRLDALALQALRIDKKREPGDLGKYVKEFDERKKQTDTKDPANQGEGDKLVTEGKAAQVSPEEQGGTGGDVRDKALETGSIEAVRSTSNDPGQGEQVKNDK
jgi:hypothetical protein